MFECGRFNPVRSENLCDVVLCRIMNQWEHWFDKLKKTPAILSFNRDFIMQSHLTYWKAAIWFCTWQPPNLVSKINLLTILWSYQIIIILGCHIIIVLALGIVSVVEWVHTKRNSNFNYPPPHWRLTFTDDIKCWCVTIYHRRRGEPRVRVQWFQYPLSPLLAKLITTKSCGAENAPSVRLGGR